MSVPVCAYKNLPLFWLYLFVKQLTKTYFVSEKIFSLELCKKLKSPHPFLNYLNYLSSSRITINMVNITTVCFSYTFTNIYILCVHAYIFICTHKYTCIQMEYYTQSLFAYFFSLSNKSFYYLQQILLFFIFLHRYVF